MDLLCVRAFGIWCTKKNIEVVPLSFVLCFDMHSTLYSTTSKRKFAWAHYTYISVSLCTGLASCTGAQLTIDRLFQNYTTSYSSHQGTLDRKHNAGRYYKEIIETYRVIFGQDKSSFKLYHSSKARQALLHDPEHDGQDELLEKICGREWTKQAVYSDIEAGPAKVVYSAQTDFPHFSERLMALQDFVLTQCPNNWKTLYWDRRDIARFWTLWAVIIFGSLSLFMSILQIGIGAAQIGVSFKTGNGWWVLSFTANYIWGSQSSAPRCKFLALIPFTICVS